MARYKRLAKEHKRAICSHVIPKEHQKYFEMGYNAGCCDTYEDCGSDMLALADTIRLL